MNSNAKVYPVSEKTVRFLGRTHKVDDTYFFGWSNSGFELSFYGTGVEAYLETNAKEEHITDEGNPFPTLSVYIDGKDTPEEVANVIKMNGNGWYTLIKDLPEGHHTLTLRKRDRSYIPVLIPAIVGAKELRIIDGEIGGVPKPKKLKIEVIGDSISCGDGIYPVEQFNSSQDGWSTYAAEAARILGADLNTIAISGNGLICCVFGTPLLELPKEYNFVDKQLYTEDVKWDFSKYESDVVIINLGTNDRSAVGEGKKYPEKMFEDEYVRFAKEIKSKYPNCKIIGCMGAMGLELKNPIERAVERVNAEGEHFMYTMWFEPKPELDGLSADENHPSRKAHIRYGRQTAEKICEVLGLELPEQLK